MRAVAVGLLGALLGVSCAQPEPTPMTPVLG